MVYSFGQIKKNIFLNFRKILKDYQTKQSSHIPEKCIERVTGTLVFHEQNDHLSALVDFPENDMNALSARLIKHHKKQLTHAKIKMQVKKNSQRLLSFYGSIQTDCFLFFQ